MNAHPAGPLADAIRDHVTRLDCVEIETHSIRTFHFAEMIAADTAADHEPGYDREMLFAATVLHDLGLGPHAPGRQRIPALAR